MNYLSIQTTDPEVKRLQLAARNARRAEIYANYKFNVGDRTNDDLAKLMEVEEWSMDTWHAYNDAYNKWRNDRDGRPYAIIRMFEIVGTLNPDDFETFAFFQRKVITALIAEGIDVETIPPDTLESWWDENA